MQEGPTGRGTYGCELTTATAEQLLTGIRADCGTLTRSRYHHWRMAKTWVLLHRPGHERQPVLHHPRTYTPPGRQAHRLRAGED